MLRLKSGLVLAGFAALALSACGSKTETTETTTTTTTTTAAAVDANGMPKHKAGLWQQTVASAAGGPGMTSKVCIDDATGEKMSVVGNQASKDACSENRMARTADGYTVNATCNNGTGGTVVVNAVVKGDYNNSYNMDVTSTTTGAAAPQMNRTDKITISSKWLGPCPAGMQPGDIEMANGMTVNMSGFDPEKAKAIAREAAGN